MPGAAFHPVEDFVIQTSTNEQSERHISTSIQSEESITVLNTAGFPASRTFDQHQILEDNDLGASANVRQTQIEQCAICYDMPRNFGVQENCAHTFCGDCLKAWRLPYNNASCPLCRVASVRALVTDAIPTSPELRLQLFKQLYHCIKANQSSHSSPHPAWSSTSSTADGNQHTPVIHRSQRSSEGFHDSRTPLDMVLLLNRRHLETRRRRLLTHRRRLSNTQRRWTTLLTILHSAQGRVHCARHARNPSQLLCELQDYVSCLHSGASIMHAVSHDAAAMLRDAHAILHHIRSSFGHIHAPGIPQGASNMSNQDSDFIMDMDGSFSMTSGRHLRTLQRHSDLTLNHNTSAATHNQRTNLFSHRGHYEQGSVISMENGPHQSASIDCFLISEARVEANFADRTIRYASSCLQSMDESSFPDDLVHELMVLAIARVRLEVDALEWHATERFVNLSALHTELQWYGSTNLVPQPYGQALHSQVPPMSGTLPWDGATIVPEL